MRYFTDKDEMHFFFNFLKKMDEGGFSKEARMQFWQDYKTFRLAKKTMREKEALEKFSDDSLFKRVFKKIY